MPKQVYASAGKTLFATATDERSADGSHHHYAFTNVPAPGAPEIPLATIKFQNGRPEDVGVNGVSDLMVLAALIDHLQGFQNGPYRCDQNSQAIANLQNAYSWINLRPNLSKTPQGATKGATSE